ncbi:MAG: glycosyltransferase family 87 protein [Pirellula sp.]
MNRSLLLQLTAWVVIASAYLLFAPNYQWVQRTSNPAYGADFMQEWVGAKMILSGHASQLYDSDVFRQWQYDPKVVGFEWQTDQFFPPVYPPPHYLLFSPFALLPYRWATVVWLLVLITTAFASAKCIADIALCYAERATPHLRLAIKSRSQYLWIGLLLFPSLLFSITLGQKSALWLLVACMTWRLMLANRDWAAGFVFGLMSIKPTLFFLLPLVMLRHCRWRFLAGSCTSMLMLWGTAALVIPVDAWAAFATGLQSAGSYAENGGYRLEWSCNLMTIAYSVPESWRLWCKLAMCLPLAIYVLFGAIEDKSHAVDSPEKAFMILAGTLLVSPHTYHYDLCLLLLPILWLCATATKMGVAYYALLAVGVTLAPDLLAWGHVPLIPILLVGTICELRLRRLLPVPAFATSSAALN